ncbi:MAG TPA: hypothetical protein VLL82_11830 [Mycobacterium sp.]|nr:hypothetical protein [Mycobacterium sp.]
MAKNRARSTANYAANRKTIAPIRAAQYQSIRKQTPWSTLLASAKTRARKKGLPFDLNSAWAQERWTGHCELTGLSFLCAQPKHSSRSFWPSIDRIHPELGYTQDNCRFVLHAVNALKGDGTDDDMAIIALALASNIKMQRQ